MKVYSYASNFLDIIEHAAVLFCFKHNSPKGDLIEKLDILSGGAIAEMFQTGEFNGSLGSSVMLHRVPETAAGRIILAGLGDKKKITLDNYRKAAGLAGKMTGTHKLKSAALYYDGPDTNQITQALTEGFILGSYYFLNYKTDKKKNRIDELAVVVPQKGRLRPAEAGLRRGEITAWAACLCRDLGGTPGNDLYPESYAGKAMKIARECGLKCRVLNTTEIKKEKMGALLSVAKGSERQPRFVVLEYNGKPGARPVVLVGKGVTFDSGGISLKPGLNMGEMKGDMLGSAVVLTTIAAVAKLKAKINVVSLMPLAENMPSGKATRPGDIITSRSGKTIEVINTDAEGRLILADALDYADKFKPQAVIDIATLTGAALYILGYEGAPFVGTNEKLKDNIKRAADFTGERVWELPLWPEYGNLMKSPVADMKNSGGKPAGTLTAASFLKNFVKDWPWAHIDIAYCDLEPNGRPYIPKGVTGFGTRLLIDLLMNWRKV